MAKIDPRRLEEVERRWLALEPTRTIERDVAKQFSCTRRAVRKYLAIVRKRYDGARAALSEDERFARVEAALAKAIAAAAVGSKKFGPDAKAMVAGAARLGELYGVMSPKKIEHSGSIGLPDYDELRRRVAKVSAGGGGAADPGAVGPPGRGDEGGDRGGAGG